MSIHIDLPFDDNGAEKLKCGDIVELSGTVYTARDAAHKKLTELLSSGKPLPFDIRNQTIYYVGPCPSRPGSIIGSAGPTTSGRMDAYAPALLDLGLKGMIGKGLRSNDVKEAIIRNKAVYFGAVGGAGALLSKCIEEAEIIAFPELGTEAVRRLKIKNFPAIVIMDSAGGNLYESGKEAFKRNNDDV